MQGYRFLFVSLLTFLTIPSIGNVRSETTFDTAIARSGHTLPKEDCRWPDTSVWVAFEGRGECMRYFHAGLSDRNAAAHLFIHGDVNLNRYSASERKIRNRVGREQEELDLPHIWLSRPGLYGSTGHHRRYRRTMRKAVLIDRALDKIKRKHRIDRFHLSGQSSGGRVVAILLSRRKDIGCAVSASGGLAQKQLNAIRGKVVRPEDPDPIDLVDAVPKDPRLRMFVVGDSWDSVVPFAIQEAYHAALSSRGHHAVLIKAAGQGRGPKYHQLAYLGLQIVKWCAAGLGDEEIIRRASAVPGRNR